MKKVLFVATITKHINTFHIPYLKMFKENGYEVHVASNGLEKIEYCDKHYNLPIERFPINKANFSAYKQLKKIVKENKYEIVHCHTPVGGVLGRLASRKERKNNTKVYYTAHGFHFYKGAPLANWIIYYPIEKIMSYFTDCLITITNEDYSFAKKHLNAKKTVHINGIGMNTERFVNIEKQKNSPFTPFKPGIIGTYVAELNDNKNQILLIEAIEKVKQRFPDIKLFLVGDGVNKEKYQKEIEKRNLQETIKLLGARNDIAEILSNTDIYLASSLREGLPINVIEAMYMKLPVIAVDNRGHRELIQDNVNGYIVKNDSEELAKKIVQLIENQNKRIEFRNNSYQKSLIYQIDKVIKEMKKIYQLEEWGI